MAKIQQYTISSANKDVERTISMLKKAVTREPTSGATKWVSGADAMRDVVTFRTAGKNKGSLERFTEANHVGVKTYRMLREAVAYGAHETQGSSNGVLAFVATPKNWDRLEAELKKLHSSRDKDKNGKIEGKELESLAKTKNGAAYVDGRDAMRETKLTGLRTEHKFSRQMTYVIDLLYSNGSIYGPSHVDAIADGLAAKGKKDEAKAVRLAYAAVSRYMSSGDTGAMSFICMDQRREVTRGLMRIFGASQDSTELAISALKLPKGY
jgi:hypothetical protein